MKTIQAEKDRGKRLECLNTDKTSHEWSQV